MSEDIEKATAGLRKFMFEHVYFNPAAKSEESKAVEMIKNLYGYYIAIWINFRRNIYRELMRERVQKNRTCVILLRE